MHSYYISDRKRESFKEVEAVGEKGLNWCDICLALFGTILFLSFGDPTAEILTLVKFYRADNKKWFTVGLVFIIFLCSLYFLVHCTFRHIQLIQRIVPQFKQILTRAFRLRVHPFCPALVKLKILPCLCLFSAWLMLP